MVQIESEIFLNCEQLTVVGLSPDPSRPSFEVTQYMIGQGFKVVGVRPGCESILDKPCYPRLSDVPVAIEIVNVFRASEHVPQIVEEAIQKGAKALWLQEGVTHPEAEETARSAGLWVVANRCILKAHRAWLRR